MSQRFTVFVICLLSAAFFVGLVWYGWTNRFGPPEGTEPDKYVSLRVPLIAQDPGLKAESMFAEVWEEAPAAKIVLIQQVTSKPWPKGHSPEVNVRAFHDGTSLYIRMDWADEKADLEAMPGAFPDGCAVMLPMKAVPASQTLMMGFTELSNLWSWRADRDAQVWGGVKPGRKAYADHHYPFEEEEVLPISTPKLTSAVQDLLAARAGSITRKKRELVQGRGVWKDGRWTVMFKRSLKTDDAEQDAQVDTGMRRFGFAVWDGDQGDRGGRKSISDWVELEILPAGAPAKAPPKSSRSEGGAPFSLMSTAYAESAAPAAVETPRLINIMAKRFQYTPSEITIEKDELVTIRLQSEDVPHGIYIDGYDINIKTGPGLVIKTTFRATETGRFSFRCSETCGEFHPYMIGFLTVTPNTRFHLFAGLVAASAILVTIGVLMTAGKEKGTAANE